MKINKKEFVNLVEKGWYKEELAEHFGVKIHRIYTLARELGLDIKSDPQQVFQSKLKVWRGRLKSVYNGVGLNSRTTIPNDILQIILKDGL